MSFIGNHQDRYRGESDSFNPTFSGASPSLLGPAPSEKKTTNNLVPITKPSSGTMTHRLEQINSHLSFNRPINYHDLNPTYFLPRAAEIEPNAIAIVHKSRDGAEYKLSYNQFSTMVMYLAHYFKHIAKVSRIAIVGPNTPAHLITMFAATAAGGIIMGLNYRLTKDEVKYMLELGQADLVIVDIEYKHLCEDLAINVLVDDDDGIVHNNGGIGEFQTAMKQGEEYCIDSGSSWSGLHAEDQDENDLLGLFFTSGTTGRPKAVEYTHRGVYLCALANVIESQLNITRPCNYLWTLPMFHAAGWTFPYAVTAIRGTHYCLRKIDSDYIWHLLVNHGITHYNAAPTVNTMIINNPKATNLSHQVRVTVAASPPSARLFQDMMDLNLYPVHAYGLTETYGPFAISYFNPEWTSLPKEQMYRNMARQGFAFLVSSKMRVVTRVDGQFVDVKQTGKEIGEIIVRGNAVTRGYHRDIQETRKSFNEWFTSGDLAVVHPDGYVQILDRKKDIIISGGENISSVAVENTIAHYPNVLESAVVGIPDKHYGESPVAFIVQKNSAAVFDDDQFQKWIRTKLGGFQVPRRIFVVTELPKTVTGKVRKNVLREKAIEMMK